MDKSLKLKMFVFKKTVMTAALLLNSSNRWKINWLICKIIWSVTVTCCLSLVLTVQNMTSFWSSLICYLYLSTGEILNQWLLRKLTNRSFSSWWHSTPGYHGHSRWSNKFWFTPEDIQNIRNKRILPIRMVWLSWRNSNTELPPYDEFCSKMRGCNPLEAEYTEYVTLIESGMRAEQAVAKLKLSKTPLTGFDKYHHLHQKWKQEHMNSCEDFLHWFNIKDVVPTLEPMQKKWLPFTTTKTLTC